MAIQQVLDSLRQLLELHAALLDIAEKKRPVLVSNDIAALTQLTNQENRLLKQVVQADQQRVEAVVLYQRANGLKPRSSMTVSELSRIVFKAEEKQALQQLGGQLSELVVCLKELNDLNRQLLEQSLAYIDYSIDLMTYTAEDEAVYQNPSMQAKKGKRPGLFDAKA